MILSDFCTIKQSISAVIRTFNEEKSVGWLIQALRRQKKYGKDLEIVVIDSGSTDSTLDILELCNVKVIKIAKDEFSYSKALNLGIEQSSGELIFILSAHSIPCSDYWVEKMVWNFQEPLVAGVYCRQIARPDVNLSELMRIERTFGTRSKMFGSNNLEGLNFSNAASCIRRSIWEQHRFVEMPAAEDREWAKWVLVNGQRIIYDAEAKVYHSHNESSRKTAHRVIEIEKASDIRNNRKRNVLLTVKQGAGWLVRDTQQTFSSNHGKGKRIKYSFESAAKSFWYIVDFNRNDK